MIRRRKFIKTLTLATSSILMPSVLSSRNPEEEDKFGLLLPRRLLGKTGQYVTMLGVGGYHVGWTTEKKAQEVIETAIEGGIRFFDSAESYSKGDSERRYGKYLVPKYRSHVFIMTKSTAVDGKTAQGHLEGSLKRLKCDYIDLWQVHALKTPDDVDKRIENEVLEVFEKAKSQGKVKHIGFTGHANPFAHKRMLEKTKAKDIFETVQMPVNAIDPHFFSFIENVFPEALRRNFGILAMKTLSDGRFFKEKRMLERTPWQTDDPLIPDIISVKEALSFVWSLPVSVLITGAENRGLLMEKISLAREFSKLTEEGRKNILEKVASFAGNKVEYYKKV